MHDSGKYAAISPANLVARQPILDRSRELIGYELLFRSGFANHFSAMDGTAASRSVIDNSFVRGIDALCDGGKAFINCSTEVLTGKLVTSLPAPTTVVEVLESVIVTDQVVAACEDLKSAGYAIALDDFVPNGPQSSLLDLADIVKVDVQQTTLDEVRASLQGFQKRGGILLAEKVETKAEFEETLAFGFSYFQGYFFAKPEILRLPEVPPSALYRMRLLQCIAREDFDYAEMESVIKSDAAMCYRLLRYLNSARLSLPHDIRSIRHGLSLLGDEEIRRWLSVVIAGISASNKPKALLQLSLFRARFCECLAGPLQWQGTDLFLLGLFSLMDAILDLSMTDLLERVLLSDSLRQALLGRNTKLGQVLELVLAYESGNWSACTELRHSLKLDEQTLSQAYAESIGWTMQIMGIA